MQATRSGQKGLTIVTLNGHDYGQRSTSTGEK